MQLNRVFRYELPTAVEFGNGAIAGLPDYVRGLGGRRVLVVCDPGVVQAGVAERVCATLREAALPFVMFTDVEPDPDIDAIASGTMTAKAEGCDLVVGVGGGSSLDTAKAIGLMMKNPGDIRDYVGINKVPGPGAPVIAIPTTAGTGSEVTIWSVLRDKRQQVKLSVGSRFNCPALALCDPELTLTLPPHITAATGMDALTHAVESFVNTATQPISEALAMQAMRFIHESLRVAVVRGRDLRARHDMLLASLIAAMAFNPTRLGLAHALALPLGARFGIPHGLVNAILLPEVMAFNLVANLEKFRTVAWLLGERVEGLALRDAAERAVWAVRRLKEDIGIQQTLTDFGVAEEHLDAVAAEAMESGNVPVNPRQATQEDLKAICRAAMRREAR
ncbi:alcohol dehydrogenase [Alicyclobacillus cellulosilyticus]|uniref:Alcohol dehydrogenase n=1 Tax=Alicyclobacillus cellulosilyticus TaxID=1003997 RepID=A0A917KCL1_9BACL|nr:iron-containing alcohol dehydrogenase [Alicyclobacillus cellulosilyticus]GGJ08281.1 alcohol dehydrogenase [Alicyclobacillus cellulosilyticus]